MSKIYYPYIELFARNRLFEGSTDVAIAPYNSAPEQEFFKKHMQQEGIRSAKSVNLSSAISIYDGIFGAGKPLPAMAMIEDVQYRVNRNQNGIDLKNEVRCDIPFYALYKTDTIADVIAFEESAKILLQNGSALTDETENRCVHSATVHLDSGKPAKKRAGATNGSFYISLPLVCRDIILPKEIFHPTLIELDLNTQFAVMKHLTLLDETLIMILDWIKSKSGDDNDDVDMGKNETSFSTLFDDIFGDIFGSFHDSSEYLHANHAFPSEEDIPISETGSHTPTKKEFVKASTEPVEFGQDGDSDLTAQIKEMYNFSEIIKKKLNPGAKSHLFKTCYEKMAEQGVTLQKAGEMMYQDFIRG